MRTFFSIFALALTLSVESLTALTESNNLPTATNHYSPLFPYVKFGGASPENIREINGVYGLGARYQLDYFGIDVSMNMESGEFLENYSVKAIPMFYPAPNASSQIFVGLGAGYTRVDTGETGETSKTTELILGREFLRSSPLKTFLQFEISQPMELSEVEEDKNEFSVMPIPMGPFKGLRPSIALQMGVGF